MNPHLALLLAFLIGAAGGLRSLTAPAAVAWAAHLHWINLDTSPLAFMASTTAVAIFTLAAVGELVVDKLPNTPGRLGIMGMSARVSLGALNGACLVWSTGQSIWLGVCLGAIGGVIGAFAGYNARVGLVKALGVPDYVVALAEDCVAIGACLLIVSRY